MYIYIERGRNRDRDTNKPRELYKSQEAVLPIQNQTQVTMCATSMVTTAELNTALDRLDTVLAASYNFMCNDMHVRSRCLPI